jgi:hypothetical protein
VSTSRRVVVRFLDDAAFDSVDGLPEPHAEVAWELLDHLQRNPYYGKDLDYRPETGGLTGSRSFYVVDFDRQSVTDYPPPYRLVYRLLPDERNPEVAEVIWAGPRDDLEVYRVAVSRLLRQPPRS